MTEPLDDWEGRLAAMAAGKRYRARPVPRFAASRAATPRPSTLQPLDEPPAFLAEPCPCDDCELRRLCAAGGLACERYALFVRGESASHWDRVPAAPTREKFNRYL